MFFSTASWNRGGGGKSTARNRNGDVAVLISEVEQMGIHEFFTQRYADGD